MSYTQATLVTNHVDSVSMHIELIDNSRRSIVRIDPFELPSVIERLKCLLFEIQRRQAEAAPE